MKINDAAKILNLNGDVTQELIKTAYRRASSKYHPDKGGSEEMMKAVNQAYEALKNYDGYSVDSGEQSQKNSYSDALNDAINAILNLEGIEIEVCGAWVWLTGETKKHAKALGKHGAGFFYASKKQAWYFRPNDWKSVSRGSFSLEDIRNRHGSQSVTTKQSNKRLTQN
jgi:hypothetical protein